MERDAVDAAGKLACRLAMWPRREFSSGAAESGKMSG
jgi:hypothetical protein